MRPGHSSIVPFPWTHYDPSDEIDEVLQRERKARDKKRPARKVLLLGA